MDPSFEPREPESLMNMSPASSSGDPSVSSKVECFAEQASANSELTKIQERICPPSGRFAPVRFDRESEVRVRQTTHVIDHVHLNRAVVSLAEHAIAVVLVAGEVRTAIADQYFFATEVIIGVRVSDDAERVRMLRHDRF